MPECQHSDGLFGLQAEIQDNWMDNIDWVKVKERSGPAEEMEDADSDDEDDDEDGEKSKKKADADYSSDYQQMVELMKPKETVLKG